ncbi:MAG: (2Fe-2S)-binding protein [Planctomycetes bacterium]|nr:(2Fe-2S)-binding protein [Planctomycetota bacterium]
MPRPTATPVEVRFTLNGAPATVRTWPLARLLDVLRTECGLTGAKEGCGEGECGACSVFVDGRLVNSCLVPIVHVAGARVETIEGVADAADVAPIREAFVAAHGAQCGICTPGMVMATAALLRADAAPAPAAVRAGLAGNLCRCTGYMTIFEAVARAAAARRGAAGGAR